MKNKNSDPKPVSNQRPLIRPSQFEFGRRLFLAGVIATSATGCKNLVQRSQSPDNIALPLHDDKKQKKLTGYIDEICIIEGLSYAEVEGIGLAVALRGTGSNPRPCNQREFLVGELESKKQDISIEPLLAGTDTELVLMKGLLPPGIRKGEKFDIEIGTLKNTEATSLENGMVMQTRMRPMANVGKGVKLGHVVALGKGRILVDALYESRTDQPNQMHGYILGGGVAMEDRNLNLIIREENPTPNTTIMIARAVNSRFTFVDKNGRQGVAEPKTNRIIQLVVPDEYRHNIGRYLSVVINTTHSETATDRIARMEKLGKEILDPVQADLTSLRLEALGNDGLPILKRALRHKNLEVRFQAAQALAYMGETDGVDQLKLVAETEPAFRWHALTALTALDKRESGLALAELMHVKSAETRYGAFRAMLTRSPQDPLANGTWLGDCYLHRIPSETAEPMLHFSRKKRPEIVLFGQNQTVSDKFLHIESRMTIRSTGNGTVSITRYSADRGEERQVCSNQVGDLIETLAQSGMSYGDLLKMFRKAKDSGDLSSRLVVNALPRLGRTYIPGENSKEPESDKSERYVNDALPDVLRGGSGRLKSPGLGEKTTVSAPNTPEPAKSKPTTLDRMKDWFTKD